MEMSNMGNNSATQYGVEKLVGTNYNYWRMCMEAYLQGQDLWELVAGADVEIPADTTENAESQRKWKIKCGKALFALRTSIGKEYIDHVRDVSSPKQVWETLERLFTKKNAARLQLLKNELAMLTQGGWPNQPSVEELENLLSNQEALAKQMARSSEPDAVLFSKGKFNRKNVSTKNKSNEYGSSVERTTGGNPHNSNVVKCYRCGKPGHIKKNCRVKLSKANVACESEDNKELKWEQCFTTELVEGQTTESKSSTQAIFNHVDKEDEWIIDSGCSHHVTGNDSLFSELHQHNGEGVIVTADNSTYPVAKEGVVEISSNNMKPVKLNDVFHVPGLKRNLVSVSQITSSGKHVLFGPNDVKILDNLDSIAVDIVFTGERREGLYL
ncbi:UNVERIFIED_CONTAM: hypothetical protein Slati_2667900 [Sesamum latifolium]|uniref:CCHC-type domain-containing protein n=1 Tax=Sesamum latifolium TaxID=2727402 RepID=A0AAW2VY55_9LAMI